MGIPRHPPQIMRWQSTLGAIKAEGSRLAITGCKCRDAWQAVDVDLLILEKGEVGWLWDVRPRCERCGERKHYMCAPAGGGTPFRPMTTLAGRARLIHEEMHGAEERQAFLKSFGFSRRDLERIKAMAERVTATYSPAGLSDLDVPFRVGATLDERQLGSGEVLGHWAGRTLLFWEITGQEYDVWARKRSRPKPV